LDVGICGEVVETIGDLSAVEAAEVIDAAGMVVSPGFIDMHSHGDFMLPFLPTADSKVQQGITLEVVGNCGSSMAPFSPSMIEEVNRTYKEEGSTKVVRWDTFAGFFNHLRQQGTSVNVAALVGHGTIREKVMGMSDSVPDPAQLAEMKDEVRHAMNVGALGLSTGLIYTPNVYARTPEIAALAHTASEGGGIYTSHIRGEGNTLLEAVDEAIEVGRRAEIRVEVSHLKASGEINWHKMPLVIEKIDGARRAGVDISADMYPYPASNTSLSSLMPSWAHVGGKHEMLARLTEPTLRSRIHEELSDPLHSNGVGWDKIVISNCPHRKEYQGRAISEISEEQKQGPLDTVMDILVETRLNIDIIMFSMKEENVVLGLSCDFVSIGTDGSGYAFEGPFSGGKPHPRNFGTFPRVLGYYSRQLGLFSLEQAVRKMTGFPADRLGLHHRGYLKGGFFADLVIFNPQTVMDRASFTHPHQVPAGIPFVMVNGHWVIINGKHSGEKPGKII